MQAHIADWFPPGYGRIVQIAGRRSGGRGGWRSRQQLEMVAGSPEPPSHTPEVSSARDNLHTPFHLKKGCEEKSLQQSNSMI